LYALMTTARRLLPWIFLVVALAATVWLVLSREEDVSTLVALDPLYVVALLALQVVYLVVQSVRFHVVLVRFAGQPVGFWRWTKLFIIGRFLNLFIPQAGNVYRAVELRRRFDVRIQDFLVAFVNAPWLAMILNFLFGAILVGVLVPGVPVAGVPLWLLLLGATVATALAPLVALAILPLFPRRFKATAWLQARLREMVTVTFESLREARYLAWVTWWTFIAFVQASVMIGVGFYALGVPVGVAEAIAFYVLLQLTTYVQVTPGNLGFQELAFAALAAGFGASAADGVLVSTIVRVTGVAALLVTALPAGGLEALRVARSDRQTGAGLQQGHAG
jgi:uncharacterized membrane protein YbhN (UPF0104 family)